MALPVKSVLQKNRELRQQQQRPTAAATPAAPTPEEQPVLTPDPAVMAEQAPIRRVPAPLPTTFIPPDAVNGGIPLTPAEGYILSTCANNSGSRNTAVSFGAHLCRQGEGYVTDEDRCDVDPHQGFLLWKGDVVVVWTTEAREGLERYIGDLARNSQTGYREQDDAFHAAHNIKAALKAGRQPAEDAADGAFLDAAD